MKVVSCKEMQAIDKKAIEVVGIPGAVLMENAGIQTVAAIEECFDDLSVMNVLILAGKGNNGGDGFVIARHLHNAGAEVTVILLGNIKEVKGDARTNLDIILNMGLPVEEVNTEDEWDDVSVELYETDIVVDAIFGTGFAGPVKGFIKNVISDVNESNAFVLAVDIPSGISGDNPVPEGEAVIADLTVTMAFPKYALVLPPAEDYCGDLIVADISVPVMLSHAVKTEFVDGDFAYSLLNEREISAHKGDFGHVLLIGGSAGKPGAVSLMGHGALTMGSGLVTAAVPDGIAGTVNTHLMEIMTEPHSAPDGFLTVKHLENLLRLADSMDAVAIGPGMGTNAETQELVRKFVEKTSCPLIIDADGINAFRGCQEMLNGKGRTVIITPHPGEMAGLLGITASEVQQDRIKYASEFASKHSVIVVLKGYRTITALPDGKIFINSTGNPGMATAGSGDLLTGMMASLAGQHQRPEHAAVLGAYFHGLAGDLASEELGEQSVTASDIVSFLPEALLGEDEFEE